MRAAAVGITLGTAAAIGTSTGTSAAEASGTSTITVAAGVGPIGTHISGVVDGATLGIAVQVTRTIAAVDGVVITPICVVAAGIIGTATRLDTLLVSSGGTRRKYGLISWFLFVGIVDIFAYF